MTMNSSNKSATIIFAEFAHGHYSVNYIKDGAFDFWQKIIVDEDDLMLALEDAVFDLGVDYSAVTVPLRVLEKLPQPRDHQLKEYLDFLRNVTVAEVGTTILGALQQKATQAVAPAKPITREGIHDPRVEWDEILL